MVEVCSGAAEFVFCIGLSPHSKQRLADNNLDLKFLKPQCCISAVVAT